MDGVVVEQKKAEHVRGDCVDAAVLERQLSFVNICLGINDIKSLLNRSKLSLKKRHVKKNGYFR